MQEKKRIKQLEDVLEYVSNDVYRSDETDGEFVISNEAVARVRDVLKKANVKPAAEQLVVTPPP